MRPPAAVRPARNGGGSAATGTLRECTAPLHPTDALPAAPPAAAAPTAVPAALVALSAETPACRACPRLVAWREDAAKSRRPGPATTSITPARFPASATRAPASCPRPGAGEGRRQPHGACLHGRPKRRLPLRRSPPRRAGEPADLDGRRRRPRASRRLRRGCRPLCAARQQATPGRAGPLRTVPPPRAGTPREFRVFVALGAFAWQAALQAVAAHRWRPAPAAPALRPRRRRAGRPVHPPRRLPPEPTEHVHRPPDAGDARRGPGAGPRAGDDWRSLTSKASDTPTPASASAPHHAGAVPLATPPRGPSGPSRRDPRPCADIWFTHIYYRRI